MCDIWEKWVSGLERAQRGEPLRCRRRKDGLLEYLDDALERWREREERGSGTRPPALASREEREQERRLRASRRRRQRERRLAVRCEQLEGGGLCVGDGLARGVDDTVACERRFDEGEEEAEATAEERRALLVG